MTSTTLDFHFAGMGPDMSNKRKGGSAKPVRAKKKIKRAIEYHSSFSEEDEAAPLDNAISMQRTVRLDADSASSDDSERKGVQIPNLNQEQGDDQGGTSSEADGSQYDSEDESAENSNYEDNDGDADAAQPRPRKKTKRNDPAAFANAISTILNSKLTTSKRSDPVLSRSKTAQDAAKEQNESKLEVKARRKLREDKKAAQDKGHVRDVLGVGEGGVTTGEVVEEEKRLKRTAQRGVVKLFNAVRAAQVQAENAEKEGVSEGTVGIDKRKEKVNEMSKRSFLDLLVSGGKERQDW